MLDIEVRNMRSILFAAAFIAPWAVGVTAADDKPAPQDPAGVAFFESKIRPVLVKSCYSCHSLESGKTEGELRVDSRDALRKGGDRGPGEVPGDP